MFRSRCSLIPRLPDYKFSSVQSETNCSEYSRIQNPAFLGGFLFVFILRVKINNILISEKLKIQKKIS